MSKSPTVSDAAGLIGVAEHCTIAEPGLDGLDPGSIEPKLGPTYTCRARMRVGAGLDDLSGRLDPGRAVTLEADDGRIAMRFAGTVTAYDRATGELALEMRLVSAAWGVA